MADMSRWTLTFVTHANVVIDPDIPVPEWCLNDTGRARHEKHAAKLSAQTRRPDAIWSSEERKARDAAEILSLALGVPFQTHPRLHENDRSATGFLPGEAFEAAADAFFAEPDQSFRGWERATDAQARIVSAIEDITADLRQGAWILVIAHGAVGALLKAYGRGDAISRLHDQPRNGGGNSLEISGPPITVLSDWQDIS